MLNFEATVFMQIRCDDAEYCLKCPRRRFFFRPQIGERIAIEEGIGTCVVIDDIKQSVITTPGKQGVTISLRCERNVAEPKIYELVEKCGWKHVIGSTFVLNGTQIDEKRTAALRKRIGE